MKSLILILFCAVVLINGCSKAVDPVTNTETAKSSLDPCYEKFMPVKFEPSWQSLTDEQMHAKVIPVYPLALFSGEKIATGKYYRLMGGTRSYLLREEDEDCRKFSRNLKYGYGVDENPRSVVGDGMIVTTTGVISTGTADLDSFVEEPAGSGNYVTNVPSQRKISKDSKERFKRTNK